MSSVKPPISSFRELKLDGRRLATLTAYDYPTARLLDGCGLDFLLVGDSLGMVFLGHPDTTQVTMADMIHHTKAVALGAKYTPVISDMPAGSCVSPATALENARQLCSSGADAVKIEGGCDLLPAIKAILSDGIPVIGHLGMLPQQVVQEGGYHIKGRNAPEADRLLADAVALDKAGVGAIVLELVHPPIAEAISATLSCPTIGIGSGDRCDGNILVLHDLIGLFPWFRPKFAKPRADVAAEICRAVREFVEDSKG